jgi:2-keto-4-pentenoate hydratase/2-oxohepta-3-ene-1,7-dioic acid hydratase in catechol pathway
VLGNKSLTVSLACSFRRFAPRVGVLLDGEVVDLYAADGSIPTSMRKFLEGGAPMLAAAQRVVDSGKNRVALSEVDILAPISDPEKILCIGLNYVDHAAECGMTLPERPILFSKYNNSICGDGDNIVLPNCSSEPDFEVELVIVIGRKAKKVSEADALSYVCGYTVGHDVSARDWQIKKGGGQWTVGKAFDTFAPIGPAIVTADSVPDGACAWWPPRGVSLALALLPLALLLTCPFPPAAGTLPPACSARQYTTWASG